MSPRRNLPWSPLALLATGFLSSGHVGTLAQTSQAVCTSTFNWMDNSKGQSPCLITAYLGGACNGGLFTVPALLPDTVYAGPWASQENPCQCSSVLYSTISACSLCQNQSAISWNAWSYNCSTVYPGIFSPGVPSGTAVPQWAYQDVTVSNMFNVTIAQSVGDNPESTATHAQSTGSVITSSPSGTISVSLTPAPSAATPASGSTSSSNPGVIVGAVIGGVVGLALLVGIGITTFSLLKKRRPQITLSAQFAAGFPPVPPPYAGTTAFAPRMVQMVQPELYDPFGQGPFPTTHVPAGHTYYAVPAHAGAYTGVPEIQR